MVSFVSNGLGENMHKAHPSKQFGMLALLAGTALGIAFPAQSAPVTEERLINAANEPQNWLTVYKSYNNHRYSQLGQINRATVSNLKMRFAVALGGMEVGARKPGQQQSPLVNDGFMYVNNAWNQVRKIDVRSGNKGSVVWMHDPLVDRAAPNLIASRGIALSGNNVYNNTLDARLVAIDSETGETVFDVQTSSPDDFKNQSHTGAPLAVKDRILVGQSNGFRGNRGWVGAFSAKDGKFLWRRNMVPGPGEKGHETWADDHNAWRTGGAAVWSTGAYDPVAENYLIGTGDPAPWGDPEFRPGDNLYSVSTVAINVNNGDIRWYFQEIPNESWDYDSINPRFLYDTIVDGQLRKVISNFSRSGFFYSLDRTTGAFMRATQYVDKVNWTAGIDPKTGKPLEYNPAVKLQSYASNKSTRRDKVTRSVCPDFSGAPTYWPGSLDPRRMIAYQVTTVGCNNLTLNTPGDSAKDYRGQAMGGWAGVKAAREYGMLIGMDLKTGAIAVKTNTPFPLNSGALSTGGDLVFTGQIDGTFSAYDSDTLAELWSINLGTPITAPAISYAAEGKQYVAIIAGGPSLLFSDGANIPEMAKITESATLYVFGL